MALSCPTWQTWHTTPHSWPLPPCAPSLSALLSPDIWSGLYVTSLVSPDTPIGCLLRQGRYQLHLCPPVTVRPPTEHMKSKFPLFPSHNACEVGTIAPTLQPLTNEGTDSDLWSDLLTKVMVQVEWWQSQDSSSGPAISKACSLHAASANLRKWLECSTGVVEKVEDTSFPPWEIPAWYDIIPDLLGFRLDKGRHGACSWWVRLIGTQAKVDTHMS